jgi:hypothetical protein
MVADVVGQGAIPIGVEASLQPGTYALAISAPGHASVTISREVLPGIVTRVDVLPTLPDRVAAFQSVVRLRYELGGQPVCSNGLLVERGVVLTSLAALGGAEIVEVEGIGAAELISSDPPADLAALQLEAALGGPLPEAAELEPGAYGWTVFYEGCGQRTFARVPLGDGQQTVTQFAQALPESAAGAPILDRTGALVGFVTGAALATPAAVIAFSEGAALAPPPAPSGGFPWLWVGGGAAAAAALGALLGGGGEDPQTQPPVGGTTGIEITFPG